MERLSIEVVENATKTVNIMPETPFEKVLADCMTDYLEMRNAEEQGLLLRLPVAIGSTIWFVGNEFVNDYEVRRYIVDETGIDCVQIAKEIDGRDYWNSFSIDDFGKTVFLTKEEAELALKDMQEV